MSLNIQVLRNSHKLGLPNYLIPVRWRLEVILGHELLQNASLNHSEMFDFREKDLSTIATAKKDLSTM
jgi:hypothetical protein